MRRALSLFVLLAACGHAPPPPPPPPELAVTTASIAGTWVTADDLDWSYRLTIAADGKFALSIDRGKLAHCNENGKLTASTDHTFTLALPFDTCVPERANAALTVHVDSFTGPVLVLALTSPNAPTEHRRYTRAAENPTD